MSTIHKYEIFPRHETRCLLPVGAKIISAGIKDCRTFIWALIDDSIEETELRKIQIYTTGIPVKEGVNLKFIQTVFFGVLVFHVFEEIS